MVVGGSTHMVYVLPYEHGFARFNVHVCAIQIKTYGGIARVVDIFNSIRKNECFIIKIPRAVYLV